MGSDSVNQSSKIDDLKNRLAEAEQLIEAIKSGEVDAFAIGNNGTREVFTLQSGDYAYRVLVEKFAEGAVNLTPEGLIVYSNKAFHELLGLSYEKVVGTFIFNYISPESKSKFETLFGEAQNGSSKGEIYLQIKDTSKCVYVSLTSLQPNLATIGMIVTDLTEKKSNQKIITGYQSELEEINQLLLNKNKQLEQQILNEFSESFAEYKTGNDFFNALTKSLADKTGLDYTFIGELINSASDEYDYDVRTLSLNAFGNHAENIIYPLYNGPCEQVIRGTLYTYAHQCRVTFPKSETLIQFNVEGYIGYPLYDTDKNPIGLIVVMHQQKINDVAYTESLLRIAAKRTELEMERIRNEKMLAAKNIELQNQNAELASFSYIASHDLQEPLRKIQTFASRLIQKERSSLSENGKDYFNRITDAAARMQTLIEALLTYSRTNTADIIFTSTDLNTLLEEVKRNFHEDIKEKKVVIESVALPTLKIVPVQFLQLFSNIIANAIKYRKPDIAPHIKITADIVSAADINTSSALPKLKYWKISIADNGIGFDPQHESKVFELFQRLHGKSEYEGTGIGLAICKKIMQNHKGIINAIGKPGEGATFNIYMPVND